MKGESRLFWLFLLAVLALSGVSQLYEWEAPPPGTALAVDMGHLPMLALYSIRRMFAAYGLALLFSIPYGYYAAVKPKLGKVLLPLLDVLQSVPILGFFPAAIFAFIALSGGSRSGVEMAAVFLIFTSQAWNMAFGVYEACTTLPQDLPEALRSMGLDRSGAFRALYLPAMIPKLVYNSMLSWAGGWYFLVACEIIAVGSVRYDLPGLGSYLIRATEQGKMKECFAGLGLLILIIVATDVLVWRPLAAWAARFRYEMAASSIS